jgi:hypothetical protein
MKIYRLISAILLAISILSFTACNNDETESESLIVGKWMLTSRSGYVLTHVEYKSNGKFLLTSTRESDYIETGKYKIEYGILYELFDDEDSWFPYQIIELSSTSLILQELDISYGTPRGQPDSYLRVK